MRCVYFRRLILIRALEPEVSEHWMRAWSPSLKVTTCAARLAGTVHVRPATVIDAEEIAETAPSAVLVCAGGCLGGGCLLGAQLAGDSSMADPPLPPPILPLLNPALGEKLAERLARIWTACVAEGPV